MKCWLYSENKLIGWANLLPTDRSMGVASGVLYPTLEYERIRPLVRAYLLYNGSLGKIDNAQLAEIQVKLTALQFAVKTDHGVLLHPVGIHFDDFMDELDEPCEVTVLGLPFMELDLLATENFNAA